jgi:hypothetical protein
VRPERFAGQMSEKLSLEKIFCCQKEAGSLLCFL